MRPVSMGIIVAIAMAASAAGDVRAASGVAQPQNPVADAIRQSWQAARRNVVESAALMTEADYGFKPVDSVRTFAQMLTHLAGANYVFCAGARAETAPHAEDAFEDKVTARAEIIKVLNDSIAYCDAAFTAATDRSLAEAVTLPFGGGQAARAAALIGNIGHLNEHYGNLVTYFRIKGIVPPSSRR